MRKAMSSRTTLDSDSPPTQRIRRRAMRWPASVEGKRGHGGLMFLESNEVRELCTGYWEECGRDAHPVRGLNIGQGHWFRDCFRFGRAGEECLARMSGAQRFSVSPGHHDRC